MPVRFFYVDESYDDNKFCLTAISVRHSTWTENTLAIKNHRVTLRNGYGISVREEVHARDLVAGRGMISKQVLTKACRCEIFSGLLQLIGSLDDVDIFNVCLDQKGRSDAQMTAWDRLINRIQRTMLEFDRRELGFREKLISRLQPAEGNALGLTDRDIRLITSRLMIYRARAVIIADEGREHEITAALRRMRVHNPIPSRFGRWNDGSRTQNIPANLIIDDPVFKSSHKSYWLQLADCAAFALLKREVPPSPRVLRYGLHQLFDRHLGTKCFKPASPSDSLGIVRA